MIRAILNEEEIEDLAVLFGEMAFMEEDEETFEIFKQQWIFFRKKYSEFESARCAYNKDFWGDKTSKYSKTKLKRKILVKKEEVIKIIESIKRTISKKREIPNILKVLF